MMAKMKSPYWRAALWATVIVLPGSVALACKAKAETFSVSRQRIIEGKHCRVCGLWLSGVDCFGGSRRQCDLESELGRPHRRLDLVAPDCP